MKTHPDTGVHLCDFPEAPPVPGSTLVNWRCPACRIGFAAAVKRGVPPSHLDRHVVNARKAVSAFGEPWMQDTVEALEMLQLVEECR